MGFSLRNVFTILFLVCALEVANSSNILGFLAPPSRSHYIIHETLMKGLAAKGHNVTVITAYPTDKSKKLPPNYHELPLILDETSRRKLDEINKSILKDQETNKDNSIRNAPKLMKIFGLRAHESLQSNVTQQLMRSGQKFNLFVLGWFFNDFQLGLAAHFQCPSVLISSVPQMKSLRDLVGNPSGMPVIPFMGKSSDEIFSFKQRFVNVLGYVGEHVAIKLVDYFVHLPYYKMNFPPEKNYPSLEEVRRNVSMVLVNSHFSEGNVRANMPNIREIAGIQTKSVPNPLPENLKNFLDEAEHGVIFFSLGTNIKSSDYTPDRLRALFEVFAKLKQRVLWKWDGATVPAEKSENVLMTNWLPQNDILAHRNTRLFISHCGLSGVIEAKFYGVPILGIPVYGDQMKNAKAIASEGWALELPYSNIDANSLSSAINELLTNETYTNKVKQLSRLYRDRPNTALDEAVFWTEYVLRHNGARHMQSPAVQLNFIQQHSLDVFAVLLIILFVSLKLLILVIVKIYGYCLKAIRARKIQDKIKEN